MKFDTLSKALFLLLIFALLLTVLAGSAPSQTLTTWLLGIALGNTVATLIMHAIARWSRRDIDITDKGDEGKTVDYWDTDGQKWSGVMFKEHEH